MAGVKGRSGSGGSRQGAGRKIKGERVILSTRISTKANDKLKEMSDKMKLTIGETIEQLIYERETQI